MSKLELFYPVRPHIVNQKWGVPNPLYQQFGFSRHNGIDLALVNGQKISAPFDCEVVKVGNQPNGGGIFVGVLSKNIYDWEDGKQTKVLLDFLHCKEILVQEGQAVAVGEVLALGDNTGLSTGSHTHLQPRRVTWENKVLTNVDVNDANNSFDPEPYFDGSYADVWQILRSLQLQIDSLKGLIK